MECSKKAPKSQATPGYVQTAVGDVNFHGCPCPWDRESVRALVELITNGDTDACGELIDLAASTGHETRAEWQAVAGEIVAMACRVADGNGSDKAFARLCEILAPHEKDNQCPSCGQFVGGTAMLQLHYTKHPVCRASAVLDRNPALSRIEEQAALPPLRPCVCGTKVAPCWRRDIGMDDDYLFESIACLACARRTSWIPVAPGDSHRIELAGRWDELQDGAGRDAAAASEKIDAVCDDMDKEARR